MPADIVKELITNNACFADGDTGVYKLIRDKQSPRVTLVMCSDSRVPTCVVKKDTINYLFVIENIGNQIRTAEGSVDYGVMHLHTPVLVVLGHTNCGAVTASFSDFSRETDGIKRELKMLKSGFEGIDFTGDERLNKYSERNVDNQVAYAMKKYKGLVDDGKLSIVGMMMDFTESYGLSRCSVYITNINSLTDVDGIRKHVVLRDVRSKVKRIS